MYACAQYLNNEKLWFFSINHEKFIDFAAHKSTRSQAHVLTNTKNIYKYRKLYAKNVLLTLFV